MTQHNGGVSVKAWGFLITLALIWGSSFILIKKGLLSFSADEVGAIRITFAGLALLPFSIGKLKSVKKKNLKLLFITGILGNMIPAFLFAIAQTKLPSGITGILNALTPLFALTVGALFFKFKFALKDGLGLAIGLIGSIILILAGSGGDLVGINLYGLFVIGATLCYGTNINLIKVYLKDVRSLDIASISLFLVLPFGLVYLLGFSDFTHQIIQSSEARIALGYLAILGIIGTAFALVLFNSLVKMTTPVFASSVTYIIPIVAAVWGVVDGENLLTGHFIGMATIILGVYLANRSK
ncbi:MAG: DMT family transporter [Bacteroidota bacterium]